MRTSCVSVVIWTSVNRIASAPWPWMMSRGSTPLPRLLDIFCPWPSWTIAWMKTSRNGSWPSRKYRLNITIRLTQSVMISRAVESTDVGLNESSRPIVSGWSSGHGQPIVDIGQRPDENQVSRTSSSRT